MYGTQLWGMMCRNNVEITQCFQNKLARSITEALWFARNKEIRNYRRLSYVCDEIKWYGLSYRQWLDSLVNILAVNLLDNSEDVWQLKCQYMLDLEYLSDSWTGSISEPVINFFTEP